MVGVLLIGLREGSKDGVEEQDKWIICEEDWISNGRPASSSTQSDC
jgi:hypothetical protein